MPRSRGPTRLLLIGAIAVTALALVALGKNTVIRRGGGIDAAEFTDSIAAVLAAEEPPASVTAEEWKRVRRLYDRRERQPIWLDAKGRVGPNARALIVAIQQGHRQGLRVADYPIRALEAAVDSAFANPQAGAAARAEVLLSATYVDFATDLLTGHLDPRRVSRSWHIDPKGFDADSAIVASLGDGGDVATGLASLRPADTGYDVMVTELARYRAVEDSGGWEALPPSPKLRVGVAHPAVGALRQRLAREGYGAGGDAARPNLFDAALAGAVADFQGRHGLPVDSAIGPSTRAALDVPAGVRADQIAANLERMRWLPPTLPKRRIVVNIPAYRLEAFDGGQQALTMRVVVGDELDGKNTPIFADSMQFVEFGPYWNVPETIAIEEILPKAQADRGYLAANDYEIVAGDRDDAPVVRPDRLSAEDITAKRYRIRQRPGDKNALGHVKFLFPNDFAVYLHDTPARGLFTANQRAASHGCVRVEDPAALARFVLQDEPEWSPSRIDEALGAGEHVRVVLKRTIPVYLVYLTAFASEGKVAFREDIYDIDTTLLRAVDDDVRSVASRDSVAREAAARLVGRLGGAKR